MPIDWLIFGADVVDLLILNYYYFSCYYVVEFNSNICFHVFFSPIQEVEQREQNSSYDEKIYKTV